MTENENRVRVTGSRMSPDSSDGMVEIVGLTKEEAYLLRGMVNGQHWVSVTEDGRLQTAPAREELPAPRPDELLEPHWKDADGRIHLRIFPSTSDEGEASFASIIIQHLCAYNYTPRSYEATAKQLESYGFDCLRSRRGEDGMYWEIWYLPGLYSARGDLEAHLKEYGREAENAVKFLCDNCSFGALDVAQQRAAMVMD